MHRIKKLILSALCIAVVFSGTTANATANSLPAGFLIGDQDGIRVSDDGEYFIHAVDLMPGDVVTKTLTIRNMEPKKTFKLFMTAEPMQTTGPADLLNQVQLELKLDGKTIYSGRLRGDEGTGMIDEALQLGSYPEGDSKVMEIKLTVDSDLKITYEKSTADIGWIFKAVQDVDADPPKTGENVVFALCLATAGTLAAAGVLLVLKKRREEKKEGKSFS